MCAEVAFCAVGCGGQERTGRPRESGLPSTPQPQPLLPVACPLQPFQGPHRPPRVWIPGCRVGAFVWSLLPLGAWCSVDAQ